MNALVAQWRPQRYMLFPVSSWKKSDFRQHRSHCERETLKVVSSSQSSNLEKSNFNFTQLSPRSKWDLPRPQHLWNTVLFPLEDKHPLLPFGLHPADTLGNWQDKSSLGVFHLEIIYHIQAERRPSSLLGNRVPNQATDLESWLYLCTHTFYLEFPSFSFQAKLFPFFGGRIKISHFWDKNQHDIKLNS